MGPPHRPPTRSKSVDYPSAVWLPAASSDYKPSSRPGTYPIDFIIIHLTTDSYDTMVKIFQDPSSLVSAHYLIRASDGRVTQCVREKDIAWHAGNWDYNTRSIGIEHEGWLQQPSYSEAMYRASAALTAHLCAKYDIPANRTRVLGHSEVPSATHPDPGPNWDWDKYMKLVGSRGND
ncbi:peptidoglycan recognition family protein [Streptomyces sp. NPDC048191]|uniref:N-acetylmuramoyl-L-alanine amidase n=1 Tax=Streptomyces sp. NPDC048191 TaxID=3155484 RepID=UPI0033C3BC33